MYLKHASHILSQKVTAMKKTTERKRGKRMKIRTEGTNKKSKSCDCLHYFLLEPTTSLEEVAKV